MKLNRREQAIVRRMRAELRSLDRATLIARYGRPNTLLSDEAIVDVMTFAAIIDRKARRS